MWWRSHFSFQQVSHVTCCRRALHSSSSLVYVLFLLGPDFSVCSKGKISSGLSGGGIGQNMDSLYVWRYLSTYLIRSNRIVSPSLWPHGEKATGVGKLMRLSFWWKGKTRLLRQYSTLKLTLLWNFVFSLFLKLKSYWFYKYLIYWAKSLLHLSELEQSQNYPEERLSLAQVSSLGVPFMDHSLAVVKRLA